MPATDRILDGYALLDFRTWMENRAAKKAPDLAFLLSQHEGRTNQFSFGMYGSVSMLAAYTGRKELGEHWGGITNCLL